MIAARRAWERLLPAALAFCFGALLFERIAPQGFFDPDGFHEMALFREWLRTGAMPHVDPFAFTPTVAPAAHHEWGAGAVLYLLSTALGAGGVMAARWLVSTAVVLVTVRAAARRAPAAVLAFCAAPAALLGAVGFTTIRAGLYTMLFLAVVLAAIDADRERPRPARFLLVWLPVALLWINLHGGWLVGAIAVAMHAGEQALRRRPWWHVAAGVAAVPALMALTPYGWDYYGGWWRSITFPRDGIAEWAPLVHSPYVLGLAAFGFAILLLLYAVVRRGPRACPGLLFVLATGWAAWRHERHVALFAVAWFIAVPGWLAATPLGALLNAAVARRGVALAAGAAALAAGVGLIAVALPRHPFTLRIPAQGSDLGTASVVYPAGAAAYLARAGFRGRAVTSFVNGGFVTWKLYPAVRVSFDGRYEVAYPLAALPEDRTIHGARAGWEQVLARYAPDVVLVERDEPLARALPGATGLTRAYRDDAYEVWARPGLGLPPTDATGAPIPVTFP
ncbi:MAG TPA: hypothetical protein VHO67_18710 [Polyangia bacterium]|nr:hypothetical protein [Polyangia bacterium]